jgi:hypothetical protein
MSARTATARALLLALAACLTAAPAPAPAQSVTAAELKAAFEYNFVKFTEWPAATLAGGRPLTICIVDDRPTAAALERTVKGRSVDGHELRVVSIEAADPLRSCHVVDLSALAPRARMQVVSDLQGAPVLTVAEGQDFARQGGIAELYVEDNRMRFAVNLGAARRAHLQLSAKLLSLATIVDEKDN